jgi:hypothetical protein
MADGLGASIVLQNVADNSDLSNLGLPAKPSLCSRILGLFYLPLALLLNVPRDLLHYKSERHLLNSSFQRAFRYQAVFSTAFRVSAIK